MAIEILFVDDDESLLDSAKLILSLKNPDFLITTATDVDKAYELLGTKEFEIIISDYQMAPKDGLEFLQLVRADPSDLPFILFTGKGREEVAMKAINMGATHYLMKGIDAASVFSELAHLVRTAVKMRRTEMELLESQERKAKILQQQVAISNLALKIGNSTTMEDVYLSLYEHVRSLMDAYSFIVAHYDEEKKEIRAGYVIAEGNPIDPSKLPPIPLGDEASGTQSRVIHSGEHFYAPNLSISLRTAKTSYTVETDGSIKDGPPPDEDETNSKSGLYVPMKVMGKVIGVLQVQSQSYDAYSPDDIELLCSLANVAALGMKNVLLFENLTGEN